jgi:hypothetical protein
MGGCRVSAKYGRGSLSTLHPHILGPGHHILLRVPSYILDGAPLLLVVQMELRDDLIASNKLGIRYVWIDALVCLD